MSWPAMAVALQQEDSVSLSIAHVTTKGHGVTLVWDIPTWGHVMSKDCTELACLLLAAAFRRSVCTLSG